MLRSRKNLEIGEWATITVSRNTDTQESKLTVDQESPVRAIENGNMHTMELKTHLYVGGYDSYKVKIAKQVDVDTNFKGCIKMVKLRPRFDFRRPSRRFRLRFSPATRLEGDSVLFGLYSRLISLASYSTYLTIARCVELFTSPTITGLRAGPDLGMGGGPGYYLFFFFLTCI